MTINEMSVCTNPLLLSSRKLVGEARVINTQQSKCRTLHTKLHEFNIFSYNKLENYIKMRR